MDKTLYVTDLDGTLMRNDKSISGHSLEIINNLIAEGANFTVATARSVSSVKDIVKPMDISIPLVVRNGTALAAPHSVEIMEKAIFTDGSRYFSRIPMIRNTGLSFVLRTAQRQKLS